VHSVAQSGHYGIKGGPAKAIKLTPERRKEAAKRAAEGWWGALPPKKPLNYGEGTLTWKAR